MHRHRSTPLLISLAIHATLGIGVLAISIATPRRAAESMPELVLTLVPVESSAAEQFPVISSAATQQLRTTGAQPAVTSPASSLGFKLSVAPIREPLATIRAAAQIHATTASAEATPNPSPHVNSDDALTLTASEVIVASSAGTADEPASAATPQAGSPAHYASLPPSHFHSPAPAYPRAAQQKGVEGVVLLDVFVGETGQPLQVALKRSSGHRALDTAALRAVELWRFMPARSGAIAVAAAVEVPVRFQLKP